MWINNNYINEKNVALAEYYVQDCDYGLKINGIAIQVGSSPVIYTPEEKAQLAEKLKDYIKAIEECN